MPRQISKVLYSSRFEKNFERLPLHIQQLAFKKDRLFRRNPFAPSLGTHKLGGKFEGTSAYSVNRDFRVHFYFLSDDVVVYVNIGTHDIYR